MQAVKRSNLVIILAALLCSCNTISSKIEYWDLKTGSHIAYIKVPSPNENPIPLLFLHGGPAASQINMFHLGEKWYNHLASSGFDIYVYDQVGCGFSERLSDPSEYTMNRLVEDLEAIRAAIGTDKFILVGDSHGATLLANYAAKYSDHILKAIVTSPGSIDPAEWESARFATPGISPYMLDWVKDKYGLEKYSRYVKLDSLLKGDLVPAHSLYEDNEMDDLISEFIVDRIFPHCANNQDALRDLNWNMEGMGFWAHTMIIWDELNVKKPVYSLLTKIDFPMLILRGDYDYLPSGMADQYKSAFHNSTMIRIPEAGHLLWLDKPEVYCKSIEDFITKNE